MRRGSPADRALSARSRHERGERGRALSAGERQRVAIARAFLADPAVLVLDEATGALDPATEAQVAAGYEAVMRGRTTIIITHRLDLARRADRVIVLERGRIVEEGTAEVLLGPAVLRQPLFAGRAGGNALARAVHARGRTLRRSHRPRRAVAVLDSGVHGDHPHVGGVRGGRRFSPGPTPTISSIASATEPPSPRRFAKRVPRSI